MTRQELAAKWIRPSQYEENNWEETQSAMVVHERKRTFLADLEQMLEEERKGLSPKEAHDIIEASHHRMRESDMKNQPLEVKMHQETQARLGHIIPRPHNEYATNPDSPAWQERDEAGQTQK